MKMHDSYKAYSLALFQISKEEDKVRKYFNDVNIVKEVFENNEDFFKIISSKIISFFEKEEMINNSFSKKIEKKIVNWLLLIIKNEIFQDLYKTIFLFNKYASQEIKVILGTIYSSFLLKPKEIKIFEKKYSEKKKKEVIFRNIVDTSLIAGIKIVMENEIIEASVSMDLEKIKQEIGGK